MNSHGKETSGEIFDSTCVTKWEENWWIFFKNVGPNEKLHCQQNVTLHVYLIQGFFFSFFFSILWCKRWTWDHPQRGMCQIWLQVEQEIKISFSKCFFVKLTSFKKDILFKIWQLQTFFPSKCGDFGVFFN
jgi:hypothetical protein